jgi:hypothetical protein
MARLESQIKLGYYPCPPVTLRLIAEKLSAATSMTGKLHLLDPCCGKGEALASLASALGSQGGSLTAYGVELDGGRAAESKRILDRSLNCSCFDFTGSAEAWSLLFLNPPYDWDFRVDGKAQRLEKTFYKETIEYLAPNGILILIIPIQAMDAHLARSIAYRFQQIRVFKIAASEYPQFQQVIVFGTRKLHGNFEDDVAKNLCESLLEAPFLDEWNDPFAYEVPATNGPALFRDFHPSLAEMREELQRSTLNKDFAPLFTPARSISRLNPILPLSIGHLASVLTAGVVNGLVRKNDKTIVVKGYTQQISEFRDDDNDDNGGRRIIETRKTVVSVRFLDESGTLYQVQ